MANRSVNYLELARFLIDKRDSTTRERVGLTRRVHRKSPGLLPQEVCTLAGVSLTSYERLERGRPLNLTRALLARIAKAFRLEADEIDTLYLLADFSGSMSNRVTWELQAVLDQFKTIPAFICTPWLDVIAFNRPADVIFDFRGDDSRYAGNQLWRWYTDPGRRKIYKDAAYERMSLLRRFKTNLASDPDPLQYGTLLDELKRSSKTFDRDFAGGTVENESTDKAPTILLTVAGPVCSNTIELGVTSSSPDILFAFMPADEGSASTIRAVYAKPYLGQRRLNASLPSE